MSLIIRVGYGILFGIIAVLHMSYVAKEENIQAGRSNTFLKKMEQIFSIKILNTTIGGIPFYVVTIISFIIIFLGSFYLGGDIKRQILHVLCWSFLLIVALLDKQFFYVYDETLIIYSFSLLLFYLLSYRQVLDLRRLIFSIMITVILWIFIKKIFSNTRYWLIATNFVVLSVVSGFQPYLSMYNLGALAGLSLYGMIYIVCRIFLKKEVFGVGDIWFNGVIGFFLGFPMIVISSFFSFIIAFIGIILQKIFVKPALKMEDKIAFAPFMSIAAFFISVAGEKILSWIF